MGDRANVYFKNSGVYLYTHWGGYDLPVDVQRALRKKWRWRDESYLTRIIFEEMVGDQFGKETGFGIDTSPPDNEYHYVVVDVNNQTIVFDSSEKEYTFTEFCELSEKQLREADR